MVQVWGSGWNVGLSAICFALTSRVGVKPCAAFTYQRIDPDMTKAHRVGSGLLGIWLSPTYAGEYLIVSLFANAFRGVSCLTHSGFASE